MDAVAAGCSIDGMSSGGKGDFTIDQPIYYRVNDDNTGPELLLEVFKERGWSCWDASKVDASHKCSMIQPWHVWWKNSFTNGVYKHLKSYQVINHILRANGLCRKDTLARALQKMKNAFPFAFDFCPETYLLPGEYTKLVSEYTRIVNNSKNLKEDQSSLKNIFPGSDNLSSERDESSSVNIWISKPISSSQGKGIKLFQDLHELTYEGSTIVQKYLERPLLIGGYKCDVRLYVLVKSFLPLSIYIYTEGIVRFATAKYSLEVLDNPFSHLTNTSINKVSPNYKLEKHRVGMGCKWTLKQLRRHLRASGKNDWLLWQKISVLVSLTLLSQAESNMNSANYHFLNPVNQVPHGTCFELYGFDILIDEKLKPWLLEVNRCPSLTYDCDVDRVVKKPLLNQMFDLVGPPRVFQPVEISYKTTSDTPRSVNNDQNTWSSKSSTVKSHLVHEIRNVSSVISAGRYNKRGDDEISPSKWRHKKDKGTESIITRTTIDGIRKVLSSSHENVSSDKNLEYGAIAKRQRFASTHTDLKRNRSEEISTDVYVPFAFNSTFYKLRRQLLTSYSSKRSLSMSDQNWCSLFNFGSTSKLPTSTCDSRRSPHKQPSKCGEWVRTFPYNATTLHGSRNPLFLKSTISEILKYKRLCEKIFRESISVDDEALNILVRKMMWSDHVMWSPRKL